MAIGLGVFFSLILGEVLGVTAGGIVVPGYIALHLEEPLRVAGTFAVAYLAFLTIKLLSKFIFIYGKRRLVMAILLGFLYGYLSRQLRFYAFFDLDIRMQAVGFIIPGLIASWMEQQGVVRTLSVVTVTAVLVKLLLMLIFGGG